MYARRKGKIKEATCTLNNEGNKILPTKEWKWEIFGVKALSYRGYPKLKLSSNGNLVSWVS